MRKNIVLAMCVFVGGCGHSHVQNFSERNVAGLAAPTVTAQAQVNVGHDIVGKMGSDFIGFSYEKSILSINFFRADNAPLIALFSKWGPGLLRIGANKVNETTWAQNGPGLTGGQTSPADVDRLAGFLRATKWKIIYGLNATTSVPELSAQEAAYVAKALGDRLQDFEIGNEPDLYHQNNLKPTNYTYANFVSDWDAYVSAVKAVVPAAIFSGPASAYSFANYTIAFASDRGEQIEQLTHHYYRANGQAPTSTIDFLLTPDPKLPNELVQLNAAAQSKHISHGYRMAETNSFYNGGAPGISNGFGTALWMIEYCFTLAQNAAAGANFHGGGHSTGYTPIANDEKGNVLEARAEYYGMLLFSMMGPGTILKTSITGNASALMSYAVAKSDGSTSVVILNNSRTDIVAASVSSPATALGAQALVLTAPSLDSTNNITFGGSSIGSDGSWSTKSTFSVPVLQGKATVTVPAGSAVLIRY